MSAPQGRRQVVVDAKQKLAQTREELRRQHQAGAAGKAICTAMTDRVDGILLDLYDDAVSTLGEDAKEVLDEKTALVLHGGSGRREMAPYSDVDLMLMTEAGTQELRAQLASRFTQHVFDAGLQLGLSVRTPREALQLMLRDATVYTSLCEARLLRGNAEFYQRYLVRFQQAAKRRTYFLIDAAEQARREERVKFGETVYLLRPNVKRSRGGLRDIHLVRWIGKTRYGTGDFDELQQQEVISEADHRLLLDASAYLLRLRNELHFHAGKSQDLLSKSEQVRIAEEFGYEGSEAVLAVERFMSAYFQHTSDVRYSSAHFLAAARSRSTIGSLVAPMFSVSIDGDFRVGPFHVGATRQGLSKVTENLADALRLMELSNAFNRRIDHPTWQAIRTSMMKRTSIPLTSEAAKRFMSLMSEPGRLADLLRRLHEMRVLEQIIPAFRHARGLLQFNEYHKYTVDEHSIRTVEAAIQSVQDGSALGEAYRSIKSKALLHLALLMHDIGKGYKEDHSELGMKIAERTAERLELSDHETAILKFLVRHHLAMANLAFRRDISDEVEIAKFASLVGSVDRLKMLFVLTCADMTAVGPEVFNDWKRSLLTVLYERTYQQLSGSSATSELRPQVKQALQQVHGMEGEPEHIAWLDNVIRGLPLNYFDRLSFPELLELLQQAREVNLGSGKAWYRFSTEAGTSEYLVAVHDRPHSGYFHKLTGVLTSERNEILAAEVSGLDEHRVLIRFVVQDLEQDGAPSEYRQQQIEQQLLAVVAEEKDEPPSFRNFWNGDESSRAEALNAKPTNVKVDNNSSQSFTLIDVFAHDRIGLLYLITRTLFELGLEIRFAKIGTYLDQVVDVFYVTNQVGEKLVDPDRIRLVCETIEQVVDDPESQSLATR